MRAHFQRVALVFMAGLPLPVASPASEDVTLVMHMPVYVQEEEPPLKCERDPDVSLETVRQLDATRRAAIPGTRTLLVAGVPTRPGLLVVEAWDPDDRDGPRLYLYERRAGKIVELDRASPLDGPNWVLRPVFFTGRGRVFIFAETGTEEPGGYAVYEVLGSKLAHLGGLAISAPADDRAMDESFDQLPTAWLRARLRDGVLWVDVEHDVRTWSRQGPKRIPGSPAKPVSFRLRGNRFELMTR